MSNMLKFSQFSTEDTQGKKEALLESQNSQNPEQAFNRTHGQLFLNSDQQENMH